MFHEGGLNVDYRVSIFIQTNLKQSTVVKVHVSITCRLFLKKGGTKQNFIKIQFYLLGGSFLNLKVHCTAAPVTHTK